jgi:hypothetical protein
VAIERTSLKPNVYKDASARRVLRNCVRQLIALPSSAKAEAIARIRGGAIDASRALTPRVGQETALCASILCDLRAQGWRLHLPSRAIEVGPPADEGSVEERKAQIRAAHLIERDAQLSQPSVRRFVRDMERRRLHKAQWHSVFSLMRDGRELGAALRRAAALADQGQRAVALRECVDAYVQVIESDGVCEFTGLRLLDVWRYFRHTWNTAYQSTPGRKVWLLVRDRAAPNHPVIGIGALGSAIVQLSPRDAWIGWRADEFLAQLQKRPTVIWARWLKKSLRSLIGELYVTDFRAERVLRTGELTKPGKEVVRRLRALAAEEWRAHRLYPASRSHKKATNRARDADWKGEAQQHLFRAKRAEHLAELLEARRALLLAKFQKPTAAALKRILGSAASRRAIMTVLRYMKAAHVGVDMMDITICGAVAPYNALLGGKLVGLLLASPQVAAAYNERYRKVPSIIASSMAGRSIRRSPKLVLLGTTSLYGVASSQYNRLKMPVERAGGRRGDELAFVPVGKTVGFGSFHFSRETMSQLEVLLAQQGSGRPVNSIFGEGVNPKLRKVRAGLDLIGLPSDVLLRHGSPRIIYQVPLARNFREVLLGLASRATPIIPDRSDSVSRLVSYWRERWLAQRINNRTVLEEVERHTLAYPVKHGARVPLPAVSSESGPLFAELTPSDVNRAHSAMAVTRHGAADQPARAAAAASPA